MTALLMMMLLADSMTVPVVVPRTRRITIRLPSFRIVANGPIVIDIEEDE